MIVSQQIAAIATTRVKTILSLSVSPRNPARLFAGTPTFYKVLCAGKVLHRSRFAAQNKSQQDDL
jgi:hypothetical protein